MSRPEREHGLEARWRDAGASGDEIEAVRADANAPRVRAVSSSRARDAWLGIEQRIETRRAHRVFARRLAFASSAAAALAGLAGWGLRGAIDGSEVRAPVAAERPAPATPDPPTKLRDDAGSRSRLRDMTGALAFDAGRIEVSADARIERLDSGEVEIDSGMAAIEVAARSPIRFRAADLRVEAMAAVFTISVEDGHGRIRVVSGEVTAARDGEEAVRFPAATAARKDSPPRRTVHRRIEAPSPHPREAAPAREAAAPVASAAPAAAPQVAETPEIPRAIAEPTPSRLRPAPADTPSARKREIGLYRSALALLRRGRAHDAAERFRLYLELYPDGLLREEAQLSRLEALHRAHESAGLAEAAAAWLGAHPDHPRAPEVRRIAAGANDFEGRDGGGK
jgi:TolA-binding protein